MESRKWIAVPMDYKIFLRRARNDLTSPPAGDRAHSLLFAQRFILGQRVKDVFLAQRKLDFPLLYFKDNH